MVADRATAVTAPSPIHHDRLDALRRVSEFLVREESTVIGLLTEISTHQSARYEVEASVRALNGATAEITAQRPPRLDHAAVFMPSNMLLYSYVLHLVVPSLFVAELTCRASAQVRGTSERLHALLSAVHRLPIRLRPVSQRAYLREAQQADLIVFTGRYANAEQIRSTLRPGQLMLFFGMGVNPFIVGPGADLERAVRDLVEMRLFNAGQDCLAPDAVLVHRDVAGPFVSRLTESLSGRRFGPYTDPGAGYGPLHYATAFAAATGFVLDLRAHVVYGGTADLSTMRIDPTVVVRDLDGVHEFPEQFAPVFNVLAYGPDTKLSGTTAGNYLSERALGASVYGDGGEPARFLIRRHTITYDQPLLAIDDGNQPFGGYGRMAGYAAIDRRVHPEPLLVSQTVARYLGGRGDCGRGDGGTT